MRGTIVWYLVIRQLPCFPCRYCYQNTSLFDDHIISRMHCYVRLVTCTTNSYFKPVRRTRNYRRCRSCSPCAFARVARCPSLMLMYTTLCRPPLISLGADERVSRGPNGKYLEHSLTIIPSAQECCRGLAFSCVSSDRMLARMVHVSSMFEYCPRQDPRM